MKPGPGLPVAGQPLFWEEKKGGEDFFSAKKKGGGQIFLFLKKIKRADIFTSY